MLAGGRPRAELPAAARCAKGPPGGHLQDGGDPGGGWQRRSRAATDALANGRAGGLAALHAARARHAAVCEPGGRS